MTRSHPKPPVINRVAPPQRRQHLQLRLMNEIPHYAGAPLEQTHHAIELIERMVDREEIPNILDSDEKIIGFLVARVFHKYGEDSLLSTSTAFVEGYNLYSEVMVT